MTSAISRRIVQIHARLYGRGPTRAKSYFADDYVLTVLEDIFTPAERTLIGAGKGEHVFNTRHAFQDALREEFVTIVAEETGRDVRAFLSQVHLTTEIASELFLLEPAVDGRGGADGRAANGGRPTA